MEIEHRIQCRWNSWRKLSGVLCDELNVMLKGSVQNSCTLSNVIQESAHESCRDGVVTLESREEIKLRMR